MGFSARMGKRRGSDVSLGKGGIGHKIKKPKRVKNPLKGLKTFGCKKITDFLSENSQLTKQLKIGDSKTTRKALGEVGNIQEKMKTPKKEPKQEEVESDIVQEINEIYEKYQTNSTADLVNLKSESEAAEKEKENSAEIQEPEEPEEDDVEMEGLCEYEKIRLRNIRERQH